MARLSSISSNNKNPLQMGMNRFALGIIGSRWALLANVRGRVGSARVFDTKMLV